MVICFLNNTDHGNHIAITLENRENLKNKNCTVINLKELLEWGELINQQQYN